MAVPSIVERFDIDRRTRNLLALAIHVWRRFWADRCLRVAASLSYTTLLALVPLLAIGFAMFSAFPAFESVQEKLQALIFSNLVPELGEVVRHQLLEFTANVDRLTAVGILALGVSALLMFATVESAFNVIWRVGESRSASMRLIIFWAFLTITPLLLGAAVTLSGYLFALTRMTGVSGSIAGSFGNILRIVPFLLEALVFTLLYMILPNRDVRWRHALPGGIVAALLFELLQKLFGLYITHFPTEETIYGALSAIPLFLVWMYIAWSVVLVGAEIAASLPEYRLRATDRLGEPGWPRRKRLTTALAILAALVRAQRLGDGGLWEPALKRDTALDEHALELILERLKDANYVARTDEGKWLLARPPSRMTLYDLYRDLGLETEVEQPAANRHAVWHDRVAAVITAVQQAHAEIMDRPVEELLDPGPQPPPDERMASPRRDTVPRKKQ